MRVTRKQRWVITYGVFFESYSKCQKKFCVNEEIGIIF
jgi:hypothetical protein